MKWLESEILKLGMVLLLLIHGAVHLLGFLQTFGIAELSSLAFPASNAAAAAWLLASVLAAGAGVARQRDVRSWWMLALAAASVSQALVFTYWDAAKIGSLPNALILAVSFFELARWMGVREAATNGARAKGDSI